MGASVTNLILTLQLHNYHKQLHNKGRLEMVLNNGCIEDQFSSESQESPFSFHNYSKNCISKPMLPNSELMLPNPRPIYPNSQNSQPMLHNSKPIILNSQQIYPNSQDSQPILPNSQPNTSHQSSGVSVGNSRAFGRQISIFSLLILREARKMTDADIEQMTQIVLQA